VKHALEERRLLLQMDHPFIVQALGTFQDAECIYLAMEFMQGGELYTLLREKRR
jgi:protein kinase A